MQRKYESFKKFFILFSFQSHSLNNDSVISLFSKLSQMLKNTNVDLS